MTSSSAAVCVIIAARNASKTIARAVRSALRESRVAEVVVVDDGWTDATAAMAREADDGSGRLQILVLDSNRGPAAARNHAIAHSSAPLIAVLDADDFFLPGRFDSLLVGDDWDFVADNIVFIDQRNGAPEPEVPLFAAEPRFLDLERFVDGNISRRGAARGEIGFLKPVMRRAFLDRHGLRYREELRLGEDYELYARALLVGARYKVVHGCGYCAVVRPDSLSSRHRTIDLRRLYEADCALATAPGLPASARRVLGRQARHNRARYQLRHFLDVKAEAGLVKAGLDALAHPRTLPTLLASIAVEMLDASRNRRSAPSEARQPRYLLPGRLAEQR